MRRFLPFFRPETFNFEFLSVCRPKCLSNNSSSLSSLQPSSLPLMMTGSTLSTFPLPSDQRSTRVSLLCCRNVLSFKKYQENCKNSLSTPTTGPLGINLPNDALMQLSIAHSFKMWKFPGPLEHHQRHYQRPPPEGTPKLGKNSFIVRVSLSFPVSIP
jgi:hypothetical protein